MASASSGGVKRTHGQVVDPMQKEDRGTEVHGKRPVDAVAEVRALTVRQAEKMRLRVLRQVHQWGQPEAAGHWWSIRRQAEHDFEGRHP